MLVVNYMPSAKAASASVTCYRNDLGHTGVYPQGSGPAGDKLGVLWTFNAGTEVGSAPVVDESCIYYGAFNDRFYCLDKNTGKKKWDIDLGASCKNADGKKIGGCLSSPTLDNGKLYFGTVCGKMMCVDAQTGSKKWEADVGQSINAPVVLTDGKIFAQSYEMFRCMDASNGKTLWSVENKMNPGFAPAVENGKVYVPDDKGLSCYEVSSTKKKLLDGKFVVPTFMLAGIPAVKDGKVYYGNMFSELFCFNASTGEKKWSGLLMINGAPCVMGDMVISSSIMGVSSLNISSGSTNWTYDPSDYALTSPVACGKRIYFGTSKGDLICLGTDGKLISKTNIGSGIKDTLVCAGGFIYLGTADGRMICLSDDSAKDRPAKLVLTAETSKMPTESSIKIKVNAYDYSGKEIEPKNLVWTVEPKDMGTMSTDGFFTSKTKTGTAKITASIGAVSDTAEIEIVDASEFVSKITVESEAPTVAIGQKIHVTAKAFDKSGKPSKISRFKWNVEPAEAGDIDSEGTFTPKQPKECTITASIGKISGSVTVKVIKVSTITIEPSEVLVNFGKTQQFKITVLDNNGELFPNPELEMTLDPPELGTIDKTGLFTASNKELEGMLIVSGYNIKATANIKVEELKQAVITSLTTQIGFDLVDPGVDATQKVIIQNDGNISDHVTFSTDATWLALGKDSVTIDPGKSFELSVIVLGARLEKNQVLDGVITVKGSAPEPLIISVKVIVSPGQNCFDFEPTVDFEQVPRGTSKTLKLTVNVNSNIKGTIKTDVPWLMVSPTTFEGKKSVEVSVTVVASALPSGESFTGHITITGNQYCLEKTVDVSVSTEKDINIKLTLGSTKATINGRNITLDVPPQSVKGSTMVPLRFVSDAFGCNLEWNQTERKITLTRGSSVIILWVDKLTAKVNGENKTLKSAPAVIKGKTFIPLRFIAEAFGATVNFDSKTQEITINWVPNN